jgi:hypothetical protein
VDYIKWFRNWGERIGSTISFPCPVQSIHMWLPEIKWEPLLSSIVGAYVFIQKQWAAAIHRKVFSPSAQHACVGPSPQESSAKGSYRIII